MSSLLVDVTTLALSLGTSLALPFSRSVFFPFFFETKADSILEIFRLVSAVPIVEAMAALVIME